MTTLLEAQVTAFLTTALGRAPTATIHGLGTGTLIRSNIGVTDN